MSMSLHSKNSFDVIKSGTLKAKKNLSLGHHHKHKHDEDPLVSFMDEEPWIAAFIDLIYVATIMNISHLVTLCGEFFNVWVMAATYFLLMFMTRYNIDVYSICFLANDIMHRSGGSHDSSGDHYYYDDHASSNDENDAHYETSSTYYSEHHRMLSETSYGYCEMEHQYNYGFAAGYVFTRAALILLYSISIFASRTPLHQREYFYKLLPYLVGLTVMLFSFQTHFSAIVIFPVVAAAELLAHVGLVSCVEVTLHPEPKANQDRLGLFFMLVLGESMIGLLSVPYTIADAGSAYMVLVFSFCLVFSVGMQFFDTAHRSTDANAHALTMEHPVSSFLFTWLHPVASFMMLIATSGFVSLYYAIIGEDEDLFGDKFKISIGLFGSVILMLVMRGLHCDQGFLYYLRDEWMRIAFKCVVALAHLFVYISTVSPKHCVIIHSFIAGFSNFAETIGAIVYVTYFATPERPALVKAKSVIGGGGGGGRKFERVKSFHARAFMAQEIASDTDEGHSGRAGADDGQLPQVAFAMVEGDDEEDDPRAAENLEHPSMAEQQQTYEEIFHENRHRHRQQQEQVRTLSKQDSKVQMVAAGGGEYAESMV